MDTKVPKLFYTPEEMGKIDESTLYLDRPYVELHFFNEIASNVVKFTSYDKFIAFRVGYIKLELENSKYEYVYVNKDLIGYFKKLYLGGNG